eukprot:12269944-Prorocentrum_lima.AAC.1
MGSTLVASASVGLGTISPPPAVWWMVWVWVPCRFSQRWLCGWCVRGRLLPWGRGHTIHTTTAG